jgi:hypothetical protein
VDRAGRRSLAHRACRRDPRRAARVSSPIEMVASRIALENVVGDRGAPEDYEGSHRLSELADFLKYIEHNALKKNKRKHISQLARAIREKNEDVVSAIKKYLDLIYMEDYKPIIN